MFAMFSQFFAMIAMLFAAGEKGAKAIDHLATWAEESAGSFADESRVNRKRKLAKLEAVAHDEQVDIDANKHPRLPAAEVI